MVPIAFLSPDSREKSPDGHGLFLHSAVEAEDSPSHSRIPQANLLVPHWPSFRVWRRRRSSVSIVTMRGVIAASGASSLNFELLRPILQSAFTVRGTKAVILLINSPGGSPAQSSHIGAHIRFLAEKHQVPVIAMVEDVAASGGYWLACAADEIIITPNSVVGSIGVVSSGFGFQDLIRKWSIERRVYTAGENKAQMDPFEKVSASDKRHLKETMLVIHQNFIDWVDQRREGRLRGDRKILYSGQFWVGAQALELGLVDGIGYLPQLLHQRFGMRIKPRWFGRSRRVPLWRRLSLGSRREADLVGEAMQAAHNEMLWSRFRV